MKVSAESYSAKIDKSLKLTLLVVRGIVELEEKGAYFHG